MAWTQSFFRVAAAVSQREADTNLKRTHCEQQGIDDSPARRRPGCAESIPCSTSHPFARVPSGYTSRVPSL